MDAVLLALMLAAAAPAEQAFPSHPFSTEVFSKLGAERDSCTRGVRRQFDEGVEMQCAYPLLKTKDFLAAWERAFPDDDVGAGSRPLSRWMEAMGGWLRRYYEVDGVPVLMAYGGKQDGLVVAFYRGYSGCADADADLPRAGQSGVTRPERVPDQWTEPIYPPKARDMRIEGMVMVRAVVDPDGKIRDLCLLDVFPPRRGFEDAALEAWWRDRYRPATRDGRPVEVQFPLVKTFLIE